MALIRSYVTYHGYPTIRTELKINGKVSPDDMMIIINPKLSVSISSGIDAEIEKFANAIDFNGLARMADTLSSNAKTPTATAIKSRYSFCRAKYNPQDGTITVTNKGGSGVEDLSYITVSVNGTNLPTSLDAKTGSVVTAYGTADSKNHIVAVATFKDGIQQVIFDTYV